MYYNKTYTNNPRRSSYLKSCEYSCTHLKTMQSILMDFGILAGAMFLVRRYWDDEHWVMMTRSIAQNHTCNGVPEYQEASHKYRQFGKDQFLKDNGQTKYSDIREKSGIKRFREHGGLWIGDHKSYSYSKMKTKNFGRAIRSGGYIVCSAGYTQVLLW